MDLKKRNQNTCDVMTMSTRQKSNHAVKSLENHLVRTCFGGKTNRHSHNDPSNNQNDIISQGHNHGSDNKDNGGKDERAFTPIVVQEGMSKPSRNGCSQDSGRHNDFGFQTTQFHVESQENERARNDALLLSKKETQ